MIVVDASVALKWFVTGEPLAEEAGSVLTEIERDPAPYLVPDLFMNELLAVLCRLPESRPSRVQEALALVGVTPPLVKNCTIRSAAACLPVKKL